MELFVLLNQLLQILLVYLIIPNQKFHNHKNYFLKTHLIYIKLYLYYYLKAMPLLVW